MDIKLLPLPRHEIVVIHVTMVTNCTTNSLSCTIVITDILGFVLDIFIFTVKFQSRIIHEDLRNKKNKSYNYFQNLTEHRLPQTYKGSS